MPRRAVPVAAVALLALAAAGSARAQGAPAAACAEKPVTARGEFAASEWLARLKARANWRHRVRRTPGLGADFGDWGNARAPTERCIKGQGGHYCVFTGVPCRRR